MLQLLQCACLAHSLSHSLLLSLTLSPPPTLSPALSFPLSTYLLIIPSSRCKIRHAHCAFSRQDFQLDFLSSPLLSHIIIVIIIIITVYSSRSLLANWVHITWQNTEQGVFLHAACILSQMFSVLLAQRELARFLATKAAKSHFLPPVCLSSPSPSLPSWKCQSLGGDLAWDGFRLASSFPNTPNSAAWLALLVHSAKPQRERMRRRMKEEKSALQLANQVTHNKGGEGAECPRE